MKQWYKQNRKNKVKKYYVVQSIDGEIDLLEGYFYSIKDVIDCVRKDYLYRRGTEVSIYRMVMYREYVIVKDFII